MAEVVVRDLTASDRLAWNGLWKGYLDDAGETLPPRTSSDTFRRVTGGDPSMGGIVAEVDGEVVGFAHYVVHPNTWSTRPLGYLEDLFVAESARGQGAATALIEALAERGRAEGWRRLYWHTEADNDRARSVYDRVGRLSEHVKYVIDIHGTG